MKALILDSGTLINLSMNGLLYILEDLKKNTDIKFYITQPVKYEVIDRPVNIPRFELGALRIKSLIENKIIELPNTSEIDSEKLKSKTKELLNIANESVIVKNKSIKIVSEAEISCLALSILLSEKNIENIIAVDERTTRILGEKPENLENMIASRLHQRVQINKEKLKVFKQFRFIRSTEIVYVAYKKGLLRIKDPKVLEAVLYATKYKGSSVSFEEINALKKL